MEGPVRAVSNEKVTVSCPDDGEGRWLGCRSSRRENVLAWEHWEWDGGRGAVVSEEHTNHGDQRVWFRVHLARGAVTSILATELVEATVEQSAFPLGQLPTTVVALVMYWLPMREAGEVACICKRCATALGDNVTWKRRCLRDISGIDVEKTFAEEAEESWMSFYRQHANFLIRIVTVFEHRIGVCLTDEFKVSASPRMRVAEFVDMVSQHPRNRQEGIAILAPHDPSCLGRYERRELVKIFPDGKPNCSFASTDEDKTIAEAGLCDGAVLEQPERMRRD